MTNINPNDDVGKINHIIKKEDKVNKKEKPVAETKQVEASSLDVLNSYGKANVTFKGNFGKKSGKNAIKEKFESSKIGRRFYLYKDLLAKGIEDDTARFIAKYDDIRLNQFEYLTKNGLDINLTTKLLSLEAWEWIENRGPFHNVATRLYELTDNSNNRLFKEEPKAFDFVQLYQRSDRKFPERLYLTDKLFYGKDEKGDFLFKNKDLIFGIIVWTNENNIKLIEKLCLDKDENGNDLFPEKELISKIMRFSKYIDTNIIEKLCIGKDKNGNDLFPDKKSIEGILEEVYRKGDVDQTFVEKICIGKDENGNDLFPDKSLIIEIIKNTTPENLSLVEKLCFEKDEKGNDIFPNKNLISDYVQYVNKGNIEYANNLLEEINKGETTINRAIALISTYGEVAPKKIKELEKSITEEDFSILLKDRKSLAIVANLINLRDKTNINEISLAEKRSIVRALVKYNKDLFNLPNTINLNFPLVPKNKEEYCTLLPSLVKSLGIEANEISTEQEKEFDNATKVLSSSLAKLSDEEFNNLSFTQEYSKDEFIKDTLSIVKDMQKEERQKVYDYFGFELHHNKKAPTEFSIIGYPVNLNNGKKLAQIEDENTKQIVEELRPYVIKFSENNKISCENKEIETALNEVVNTLPELRTTIGRNQYGAHEFDVLKHSLKLMQKTVQNPKFETLNDSDKKIMILSSLLHDITKAEVLPDPMHNFESSFDAFYISKKFNLSQEERIKLYTLINHHEWLKHLNRENISEEERTKRIESVAFDFRNDNLFELTKIFTESDIKAVVKDNHLFDILSPVLDKYSNLIEEKITELKKTQPLLPTTKLPKASEIRSRITTVNDDCSTNIKGVYLKDDVVIIKYNEVEDWESVGLPKGSISRGIKTISPVDNNEINTGNIKFIAHGLDYSNQLINFDAFALPDSDALLSVSYMERPESKYRLFRTQGVLLDVDSKYVHGGGETDSGSGCGKNISEFKTNYAFDGAYRHEDRKYIADLIKETLNLTDKEYIEFVNKNRNKSMLEIEPKEIREALIKKFALINSNTRRGNREYNEMYVSNPKVQGVFAYSADDSVGKISSFMENQHTFLKDYAKENDIPFIVFGD